MSDGKSCGSIDIGSVPHQSASLESWAVGLLQNAKSSLSSIILGLGHTVSLLLAKVHDEVITVVAPIRRHGHRNSHRVGSSER